MGAKQPGDTVASNQDDTTQDQSSGLRASDYHKRFVKAAKEQLDPRTFQQIHHHAKSSTGGAAQRRPKEQVNKSWASALTDMWTATVQAITGGDYITKDAPAAPMTEPHTDQPIGTFRPRKKAKTSRTGKVPPQNAEQVNKRVEAYGHLAANIAKADNVANQGFAVHLVPDGAREAGAVGIDVDADDDFTIAHDLNLGIPLEDGCADVVYVSKSALLAHGPELLQEVQRIAKTNARVVAPVDMEHIVKSGGWDESSHPRDNLGRFGSGGGSSTGVIATTGSGKAVHGADDAHYAGVKNNSAGDKKVAEQNLKSMLAAHPKFTARDHEQASYVHSARASEAEAGGDYAAKERHSTLADYHERAAEHMEKNAVKKSAIQIIKSADRTKPQADKPLDERLATVTEERRELVLKALNSTVPIAGVNQHEQIMYGPVLVPNERHYSGDYLTPEDIRHTAHGYMQHGRMVGAEHHRDIEADVVESFIAPTDIHFDGSSSPYGEQTIPAGSWVAAIKIHDPDEWAKVMSGEYTGFSTGGWGSRGNWEDDA